MLEHSPSSLAMNDQQGCQTCSSFARLAEHGRSQCRQDEESDARVAVDNLHGMPELHVTDRSHWTLAAGQLVKPLS